MQEKFRIYTYYDIPPHIYTYTSNRVFFFISALRIALAIPPETHGMMEGRAKCRMYDVNYTDVLARGLEFADPDWPTRHCDRGWEFNFTVIPYATVATEVII